MRLVIALGGNALASSGRPEGADRQRERIADAASAIADIARVHEVVITHGNGPQIGFLAAQNRFASELPILPLDVLGAETEGMIGYWLESALASIFPGSELATLLTQVEVAADDPAFDRPSKPIGPCVSAAEAEVLTKRFGFVMAPVDGGLRRIVPSPRPLRIREDKTIELLVDAGVLVICAGGGGIPVVVTPGGGLHGVEAVIDKDLTAAVLAEKIRADRLLLLTNVPAVYADWPTPCERLIHKAHPDALAAIEFEPGSMGPKVEAAVAFAKETGRPACIGALEEARRVLEGEAGTWVSIEERGLEEARAEARPAIR
ncbi:MAG: carbamate kinase [Deltaproteobacteria bacterium]|nr:carbamate kinase [Deltaproteobacteria bacterium]